MKIEFFDRTVKKVNMYLPFTLLFISTIIVTVIAFIMLPLILAYLNLSGKQEVTEDQQVYEGVETGMSVTF